MTYRSLDPNAIVKTLGKLRARISERFPGRGIEDVAIDLCDLSVEEVGRARKLSRPRLGLRFLLSLFIAGAIALFAYLVWTYRIRVIETETFHLFQGVEAFLNIIILVGAGIFFLLTLETRIKRNAVLNRINQLRSIAHVIDMHQLTKDPSVDLHSGPKTESSPDRDIHGYQLVRYLEYCAEMLSLTGKLAAIYLEYIRDPVVIAAVGELENLTSDLSRKVWQKISVLDPAAAQNENTDTVSGALEGEPQPADDLPDFLAKT